MEAKAIKIPTAFRLNKALVNKLKEEAKKANRSLNNYVECILMDSIYTEPNEETIKAIEEARRGEYAGIVDTSSVEAMIKSME